MSGKYFVCDAGYLELNRHHVNNVFSSRAFSVSAPTFWNSLQSRTRSSETYATFRNRLKTELLMKSYTTLNTVAPSLRP